MFGKIDQIAYVVADLDAAVAARMALGIGPWTIVRGVVLNGRYRGVATDVVIDLALGFQGALQIELIRECSKTPSPYTGAQGLHHLAWLVDSIDAPAKEAERRGLVPVFDALNHAVRVIYFERPADPGSYFELIEGPGIAESMAADMAAAAAWDGSDPITEWHWARLPMPDRNARGKSTC